MAVMGAGFCLSYGVGLPVLAKLLSAGAITRSGLLLTAAGMLSGAFAGKGVLQWLVLVPSFWCRSLTEPFSRSTRTLWTLATRPNSLLSISIAVVNLAWGLISIVSGYLTAVSAWAPIGSGCRPDDV